MRENRQDFRVNEIFNVLNDLVKISPAKTRSKSLLILSKTDDWSDDELKNVLRYAWFLKFLDFSILKSNVNSKMVF